ncbi:hypothetical protein AAC387_Pa05g0259 [Persea americana]
MWLSSSSVPLANKATDVLAVAHVCLLLLLLLLCECLIFRLLNMLLGHSYSDYSILHASFGLIHLGILRQPELPQEFAAAPLKPVPLIVLLFFLSASLSAYLQDPPFFEFDFHIFLLQTWKVSFEDMSFWGLLPVYPGIGRSGCLPVHVGIGKCIVIEWESLEGIPNVKREGVGSLAEDAGNNRHLGLVSD